MCNASYSEMSLAILDSTKCYRSSICVALVISVFTASVLVVHVEWARVRDRLSRVGPLNREEEMGGMLERPTSQAAVDSPPRVRGRAVHGIRLGR